MGKTAWIWIGLMGVVVAVGCTPGGNPPADDGDEEVAAFLPTTVDIDISELPEDGDDVEAGRTAAADNYSRTTRSASTIVQRFARLADRCLALAAAINADMTGSEQTQVSGDFTVNGTTVAYKADFAAFDFDGDGNDDGSGNAVDVPIAVRIWVNLGQGDVPFFCALVTSKPSTGSLGAGELYANPAAIFADVADDVRLRATYDRTDANHKWNQAYLTGQFHPAYSLEHGFARVDTRPEGDTIGKTVRAAASLNENPYGLESVQTSLHYPLGATHVLASARATGLILPILFEDICLEIATLAPVVDGSCDAFDTQDMEFLDVPIGDEAQFPADFPATPTF